MHLQNKKGFTLIEIIVSLAIFSIVMLLVAGTYISLISASADVRTETSAMNNVAAVLSAMSNDIRNGKCKLGQCVSGNSFTFTNSSRNAVMYGATSTVCPSGITNQICKSISGGTAYVLTHTPVKIAKLNFTARTYSSSGTPTAQQTFITITIDGSYTLPHQTQSLHFHFETVVTPRSIYIQ